MKNKTFGLIVFVVLGIFVLAGFLGSIERVEAGYAGIIQNKNNGEITIVNKIGWTFVNPFTEKFAQYPISTETLVLTKNHTEGSEEDDSIDAPTREGQNINVDVALFFKVSDVEKLYKKYRGADIETITQRVIRNAINNEFMAVTGKYSILEINDKRDEIISVVNERLAKTLDTEGIDSEKFQLRAVRLPESVRASFDAKVDAENKIRQAESKLKQAKIDAEIKLTQAKAESDSNKLLEKSLTPAMLEKMRIEKLNPNVEVIYVPSNGNMLLNPQK